MKLNQLYPKPVLLTASEVTFSIINFIGCYNNGDAFTRQHPSDNNSRSRMRFLQWFLENLNHLASSAAKNIQTFENREYWICQSLSLFFVSSKFQSSHGRERFRLPNPSTIDLFINKQTFPSLNSLNNKVSGTFSLCLFLWDRCQSCLLSKEHSFQLLPILILLFDFLFSFLLCDVLWNCVFKKWSSYQGKKMFSWKCTNNKKIHP